MYANDDILFNTYQAVGLPVQIDRVDQLVSKMACYVSVEWEVKLYSVIFPTYKHCFRCY